MNDTESPWKDDDAARARVAAELTRIDKAQADAPQCWMCGQRTYTPDRFGLCSKTTPTHLAERQKRDVA